MRNKVVQLCARVGIAALASLPVSAVGGGVASAAPNLSVAVVDTASAAPTPEECTAIRQAIEALKAQRRLAQEELVHAAPHQKGDIIREIRELTAEIRELARQLTGCPAQG